MAEKMTIITRWESWQMSPEMEWRMWRQLKGSYHIDRFVFVPRMYRMDGFVFDQFDTMEEALASLRPKTRRCFIEPGGQKSVKDLPHGDVALIIGNTFYSNRHLAADNEVYSIRTDGGVDLYGINAGAIALACEYGQ